jgi:hypothetical protein
LGCVSTNDGADRFLMYITTGIDDLACGGGKCMAETLDLEIAVIDDHVLS